MSETGREGEKKDASIGDATFEPTEKVVAGGLSPRHPYQYCVCRGREEGFWD